MPQTTLYDRTGASIGSVELSDALFDAPVNEAVLHQVVTAQLAGRHLAQPRPGEGIGQATSHLQPFAGGGAAQEQDAPFRRPRGGGEPIQVNARRDDDWIGAQLAQQLGGCGRVGNHRRGIGDRPAREPAMGG